MSAPVVHDTDPVFGLEQHGIDLIGDGERRGKPLDLFWMWAGTNLNVYYIVNGVLLVGLGLSFVQSVIVIVLASLSFFFVGLISLQGPRTGTATFAITRASVGPNGARGLAVFNWLTCIGFEASGVSLIVLAVSVILQQAGIQTPPALQAVFIIVAAAVVLLVPLLGHATLVRMQRYMAWVAAIIFAVVALLVIPKIHLGTLSTGGTVPEFFLGIALLVNGGGLSWANVASDYSRYLPRNTSPRKIFWSSSLGGLIPSLLLAVLGAGLASVVHSASDPISGLPKALPGWVLIPYLVFIIVSTILGNGVLLYSSGLTLQTIGVRLKRWQCVLVDGVISTVIAFVVVFASGFDSYYYEFLGVLGVWLAPWAAIYIVDWLLRRGRYDATALLSTRGGRYWRNGGFHLPGVLAQIIGMLAALLWINTAAFVGPLSVLAGHSDLSIFLGLIVGGGVYYFAARRTVRAETLATPEPTVLDVSRSAG